MQGILTSRFDRRRRLDALRRWHQWFQPQLPFQELHLLTEPPAGGTETELMQGASAMLDGPIDRRLHRSPHILDHRSHDSTVSYTRGGIVHGNKPASRTHVTSRFSRMLKKSASGVLASFRGSTYRSVRLASSLAAASLDGHFEHPAWCTPGVPDARTGEIQVYAQSFSAAC